MKDCGADVNSKVARQCEPFFVEAIVEVTTVSESCVMIILLFHLLLCVSDSVPIHSTPVCGIHLHQSSMTVIIAVHVG